MRGKDIKIHLTKYGCFYSFYALWREKNLTQGSQGLQQGAQRKRGNHE
jgi:hypothetical protein